eukprot:CAMPEP_0201281406 /NCGR_PEP_ID=MMETSP1317-20130820/2652_1 /ASSEMBLY_ACC=CAM_ASM_000770 /TAXON_ID=187299 /ORGANISM="Undescribed Undescribed, Strain Undescribed" /LENGTH=71 /DNA_ID=CAMNT_0047591121 /DNA_START=17 /DNA_END=232 /DNA_ORIENTATION=-
MIVDEGAARVIYEGWDPVDMDIDDWGDVYFVDEGANIVGVIPYSEVRKVLDGENQEAEYKVLYSVADSHAV